MGTSVSSTKAYQRIQSQREQRKQVKYNNKTPNNQQFFPLHQRETTRQNIITKNITQSKLNNHHQPNLQKYAINLKTNQNSNPQEEKLIQNKNNDIKKPILIKDQTLKKATPSDQNILTIRQNQPQKQVNFNSSMQQITFSSKKLKSIQNQVKPKVQSITQFNNQTKPKFELKNPQQNESNPKTESPKKPNICLQTPVSQQEKPTLVKFQPVSLNPQFSQFEDKKLSEKERKRKEQVIKYIKDSQFLSGNKTLSNTPYQANNKNHKKVDELLPSKDLGINLLPQTPQKNQAYGGQAIKLKTQQQELDIKKGNHSMTLDRKNKNISSFKTANKRN